MCSYDRLRLVLGVVFVQVGSGVGCVMLYFIGFFVWFGLWCRLRCS